MVTTTKEKEKQLHLFSVDVFGKVEERSDLLSTPGQETSGLKEHLARFHFRKLPSFVSGVETYVSSEAGDPLLVTVEYAEQILVFSMINYDVYIGWMRAYTPALSILPDLLCGEKVLAPSNHIQIQLPTIKRFW